MSDKRYFVTHNSVTREVFPYGGDKLKIQNRFESGQIFKRRKLSGKLIFINKPVDSIDDFTYFKGIELGCKRCEEIKFVIKRNCGNGYSVYWEGYFSTGSGSFDYDRCIFEVQAEPDDDYRCIFDNWEKKFNMFDFPILTTRGLVGTYKTIQGNTTGNNVGDCNFFCDALMPSSQAANTYAWDVGGYSSAADMVAKGWCVKDHVVTPYNECDAAGPINRRIWKIIVDDATGFLPCQKITFFNDLNAPVGFGYLCKREGSGNTTWYISNLYVYTTFPNFMVSCNPTPIIASAVTGHVENPGGDTAIIVNYDPFPQDWSSVYTIWHTEEIDIPLVTGTCATNYPPGGGWVFIGMFGSNCRYRRCPPIDEVANYRGTRWLDMIDRMVNRLCTPLAVSSIFYDKNPDTADPHYQAGINYVTQDVNKVAGIVICQKSDVMNPTASNPATIGMVTLKMMLQWAREVHNVYWKIDDDTFIIEHFSFWNSVLSLDLTQSIYDKWTAYTTAYSSLKEKVPQTEKYKWDEETRRLDFAGKDIIYLVPCVTVGLEETHAPEKLNTDLRYLLNNTEANPDGFVMIGTELFNSQPIISSEFGILSGQNIPNAHHSWANLHYNYHRHNRFLEKGNMNGNDELFFSWKPTVKQVTITIPECCELPADDALVKTSLRALLGEYGEIEAWTENFKPDTLELELVYRQRCTPTIPCFSPCVTVKKVLTLAEFNALTTCTDDDLYALEPEGTFVFRCVSNQLVAMPETELTTCPKPLYNNIILSEDNNQPYFYSLVTGQWEPFLNVRLCSIGVCLILCAVTLPDVTVEVELSTDGGFTWNSISGALSATDIYSGYVFCNFPPGELKFRMHVYKSNCDYGNGEVITYTP